MKKSSKFLSTVLIAVLLSACQNPFAVDDDDDDESVATTSVSSTSRGSSATSTESSSTTTSSDSSSTSSSSADSSSSSKSTDSDSSGSTATSSDSNSSESSDSSSTDENSSSASSSDATADGSDSSGTTDSNSAATSDNSSSETSSDSNSDSNSSDSTSSDSSSSSDSTASSSESDSSSDSSNSAATSSDSDSSSDSSSSSDSNLITRYETIGVTVYISDESSNPTHWVNQFVCENKDEGVTKALEEIKKGNVTLYLGHRKFFWEKWEETTVRNFWRNDVKLIRFDDDDLYLTLLKNDKDDFSDCLRIGHYYFRFVYNNTEYKGYFDISLFKQLAGYLQELKENYSDDIDIAASN